MSDRRKHTFDEYRENYKQYRKDTVRKALKYLANSNYSSFTALSKDVARIVSEIDKNKWELAKAENPELDSECPKPVSNTTFTRKSSAYRTMLKEFFEGRNGDDSVDSPNTELEKLQAHCAHLEMQNEILKNRVSGMVQQPEQKALEDRSSEGEELKKLREEVDFLVDVIDSIMGVAYDIFRSEEDGLYSAMGERVLTKAQLERYLEITNSSKGDKPWV